MVVWVDCRYYLFFVFLGGARFLYLSAYNTASAATLRNWSPNQHHPACSATLSSPHPTRASALQGCRPSRRDGMNAPQYGERPCSYPRLPEPSCLCYTDDSCHADAMYCPYVPHVRCRRQLLASNDAVRAARAACFVLFQPNSKSPQSWKASCIDQFLADAGVSIRRASRITCARTFHVASQVVLIHDDFMMESGCQYYCTA